MKHLPKLGSVSFRGEELGIYRESYKSNGRLAVVVSGEDGSPLATLSCNVVEAELPDADCFHVKTWSENAELAEAVRRTGIFTETGLSSPTGRVVAPVWRIRRYVWVVQYDGGLTVFSTGQGAEQFASKIRDTKITKAVLR